MNRMHFDRERVRLNVRQADTEDLLDRITVYRKGMEPEAVEIIEAELNRRGVRGQEFDAHAARRAGEVIFLPDGTAARCTFCHNPAVAQGWGWHRVRFGFFSGFRVPFPRSGIPLFPRFHYYCQEHCPAHLTPAPSSRPPE